MKITKRDERLITILQKEIAKYLDYLKNHELNSKHRAGGYLTVFKGISKEPILRVFLGEEEDESRVSKTYELSEEKCLRLMKHPSHTTSYQSRDEDKARYGGSVRFDFPTSTDEGVVSYFVGFSGCPEDEDEAAVIAGYYRFSNDSSSLHIPDKRENPFLGVLVNGCS